MNHLTQEEIVMAYYGEPCAHLDVCDVCRAELGRIAQLLDRVVAPDVPEPDEDYEQRVWQRLSWRLRGEKKKARRTEWLRWGAVAAVVVIAFAAGLLWRRDNRQPLVVDNTPIHRGFEQVKNQPSTQQQRDRILLIVVNEHFDESERILVELSNMKPEEGTDIGPERARAEALLASNRLYRRTAEGREGEE
ncbi:MAG TPA: hypothetical protein VKB93_22495, partial [Thermoanaerobaculia bacterium]|nr:hypothetical protein [Thermoanaerobaculia bacterium]